MTNKNNPVKNSANDKLLFSAVNSPASEKFTIDNEYQKRGIKYFMRYKLIPTNLML